MSRSILLLFALLLLGCPRAEPPSPTPTKPAPAVTPEPTPQGFQPPGEEERTRAIGPGAEANPFFSQEGFQGIPEPGPMDWLAEHEETGQTFGRYRISQPNKPTETRSKIYIQPLGEFGEDQPSLTQLADFTTLFFALEVVVLDPLDTQQVKSRLHPLTQKKQLHTGDILERLKAKLPADAFCLLGVTTVDIYPSEDWNFVFGMASLSERVGIYSLARYDPAFLDGTRPPDWERLALLRSCKVLAHETGHMLGMPHCIYFHCLMNGSNHMAEVDSEPLFLCPVCLRKLHFALGVELGARYQELLEFCEAAGFEEERQWLTHHLSRLGYD